MIDLDAPLAQSRTRAELTARRARRRAQLRRRRNATGLATLALAGLAVLPVMAASAGTTATLPSPHALDAGQVASAPPLARCPIPVAVRPALENAAAAARVDLPLVAAVAETESAFDPVARSGAGAQGLMQLEPQTAAAFDVADPYNPDENAAAGARYLRSLLDRYQQSLTLALAAYNAGPSAVDRAGGVPDFPETIAYVAKVSAIYQSMRPCR